MDWKVYGYIGLVQFVALLSYMQLNIGHPKDEAYIIGALLVIGNGLISWFGRSPSNPIKTWQAPKLVDVMKGEGDRKRDPKEDKIDGK